MHCEHYICTKYILYILCTCIYVYIHIYTCTMYNAFLFLFFLRNVVQSYIKLTMLLYGIKGLDV